METPENLARRFEEERPRLRTIAARMLGSAADAEDVLQEAWLRLARAGGDTVGDLGRWLNRVVARLCLDALRARAARRESGTDPRLPAPWVAPPESAAADALLDGSLGWALQVVLDTLSPAERLAFVLHDVFGLPFGEVAANLGRSDEAARQLASRARRRVRGVPEPSHDHARQRLLVDAFLAASRTGDPAALLALLDPDVTLTVDFGPSGPGGVQVFRGAQRAAEEAIRGARTAARAMAALVNGTPGLVGLDDAGRPMSVLAFGGDGRRISMIEVLADPERVTRLLPGWPGEQEGEDGDCPPGQRGLC